MGEEAPRTVVSGLVKYIPEAEMQGRRVVLVCNLKPANMRGIQSQAMVLAATAPDGSKVRRLPLGALGAGELAAMQLLPDNCCQQRVCPALPCLTLTHPALRHPALPLPSRGAPVAINLCPWPAPSCRRLSLWSRLRGPRWGSGCGWRALAGSQTSSSTPRRKCSRR